MRKQLRFSFGAGIIKQELAPCCDLLMLVGESTGDGSTLPGSTIHSREPNGFTGDVQAGVQKRVERETARRSQNAGEEDAQHRRSGVQPRRSNGLRDIWKRTGGGKPRTKGNTARAGYERWKSTAIQHRVAKGVEDTNREIQRKLAVVNRESCRRFYS
jgi:hypothetical protein